MRSDQNQTMKRQIEERVRALEEIITKYLPKEEGYQSRVIEAMNYSVLAGGKRLRPMLMAETYRLFGGTSNVVEPFLAAIEMIHTYSLVHDDLPAMDNDQYRRGKLTTHARFGEDFGILAGDGLLNLAFETAISAFFLEEGSFSYVEAAGISDHEEIRQAAEQMSGTDQQNGQISEALRILAGKAGIYGMIGGQAVDVAYTGRPLDFERLDFIYRLKTGALLEASMMIGACLAGADASEIQIVEESARDLGCAFQIQDDILDVTSSQEVLGKPIGSDEKNHKTTYVSLVGLKKAQEEVAMRSKRAIKSLSKIPYDNPFLTQLMHDLIFREK